MPKASGYGLNVETSTKEAVIYFLLFIGLIALILWYISRKITAPFSAASDAAKAAITAVSDQVSGKNAAMAIDTALGIDTSGKAYQDWLVAHTGAGLETVIGMGNAITPAPVFASAAVAGQEYRQTAEGQAAYTAIQPDQSILTQLWGWQKIIPAAITGTVSDLFGAK